MKKYKTISSYLKTLQKNNTLPHIRNIVDSFIEAINNDRRNNNQFFISIDANKVLMENISGRLGESVNGGNRKITNKTRLSF